jgi:hypothetical protein
MKTISLIAIVFFCSSTVNGFTLQEENKYDKLVSGLVEKLRQNKTAFKDFAYADGMDFGTGAYRFKFWRIRDTDVLGLEDAVSRKGVEGRERGNNEIYISPVVISIPNATIDGLMDVETKSGSEYTVPFVTMPETIDIKMSLTFDKRYKRIAINNMGFYGEYPRIDVQVNCTAVENLPPRVCADVEQFFEMHGLSTLLVMRFISVISSIPWDF